MHSPYTKPPTISAPIIQYHYAKLSQFSFIFIKKINRVSTNFQPKYLKFPLHFLENQQNLNAFCNIFAIIFGDFDSSKSNRIYSDSAYFERITDGRNQFYTYHSEISLYEIIKDYFEIFRYFQNPKKNTAFICIYKER